MERRIFFHENQEIMNSALSCHCLWPPCSSDISPIVGLSDKIQVTSYTWISGKWIIKVSISMSQAIFIDYSYTNIYLLFTWNSTLIGFPCCCCFLDPATLTYRQAYRDRLWWGSFQLCIRLLRICPFWYNFSIEVILLPEVDNKHSGNVLLKSITLSIVSRNCISRPLISW